MNRYVLTIRLVALRNGYRRAEYLKRLGYFHQQGEGCFFQPVNFGTEPHLVSFGSNVYLASGVRFLTHDVVALMLRAKLGREDINERMGPIEIGSNVFIGSDTSLLYDVRIGDDVIVAAGSLVTKDLPAGSVCAGRPARVVGSFQDYERRMLEYSNKVPWRQWEQTRAEMIKAQAAYFWTSGQAKPFPKSHGSEGEAHGNA